MYINIETNEYPISEYDIKSLNPNVSFSIPFRPPEQYAEVFPSPKPSYNQIIENVIEIAPEFTNKNFWEQRWQIVKKYYDYTDDNGVFHSAQDQEAAAILDAKNKSDSSMLERFDLQLALFFDKKAQEKKYDNRITAALRAGYTGPYQAECILFAQWMDNCNVYTYQALNEVISGTRPEMTFEELVNELPILVW